MAVPFQNTTRVVATSLVLFFVAFALTAYSARNPSIGRVGAALASEMLRPIQALNRAVNRGVFGLWDAYIALVGVKSDNVKLMDRLAVLEAENSRLLEFEHENKRLRSLLGVSEITGLSGMVANIIAYDPSNWIQAVSIDRGSSDGVEVGMPVIEGNGVVGQVISAGVTSARVLLLTDHSSGVDSIIQGSRTRGIVEGSGGFQARWNYVLTEDEVAVGDRVITSGLGGVFPKGLLVGIVSDLGEKRSGKLFQHIEIKPSVDFSRLESVLVATGAVKEKEQR